MLRGSFDLPVVLNRLRAIHLARRKCLGQVRGTWDLKGTAMIRWIAVVAALFVATSAAAQDRYVGYYYPEVKSTETFDRVVRNSQGASKSVRIDFVNVLTKAQLEAPESPRFVFFTKGEGADTLILTALDDDVFSTLYRARAILAQLTVSVRQGGYFKQQDLQYVATFYDLLQLMAFEELIISDGQNWAHRVDFVRQ